MMKVTAHKCLIQTQDSSLIKARFKIKCFKIVANCSYLLSQKIKKEQDKCTEEPRFTKLDNGHIKCLKCLKTFGALGNARTHYREKHIKSTESFSCTFCGQLFSFKRYLQDHMNKRHNVTQKMLKNSIS
jgi:hypothetical protein